MRPIPYPMVSFLADEMTADFFEELLEFLVVDWAEGSHRSGGGGDFDDSALLPDDAGRAPLVLDLLPAVLLEDFRPSPLLGDFLDKSFRVVAKDRSASSNESPWATRSKAGE